MPRIKPKRQVPKLDMTPMVDLFFLLVTFFMLTTQFRPEEPVTIDMPNSVAQIPIPQKNIMTISVSKGGRVFFDLTGKEQRKELLDRMSEKYQIGFTEEERETFSNLTTFGAPMSQMRQFLNLKTSNERKKFVTDGIPTDSTHNELEDWVLFSRLVNPSVRLAIKGDKDTDFATVKNVFETVQGAPKVNRFNLITSLEGGPTEPVE